MTDVERTKILVDGNCVVCDFEVSHYKRLAPNLFDIVDISSPQFDAQKFGLTTAAVNKHLHVITPDGTVLNGVDGFAHIWSRLPRYAFASRIIKVPLIHKAAQLGYVVFAEIRPWLPKKHRV